MKDLRDSWFMQQNFKPEELQKLWDWSQVSGEKAVMVQKNDKWIGYHVEDKDQEIDLVQMKESEQCKIWINRLGFELVTS